MAVRAVIFDWGGTLTPWHTIDHDELWLSVCAQHFPPGQARAHATAARAAEAELWLQSEHGQRSATLGQLFELAGFNATAGLLDSYFRAWDPHTYTDPAAAPLLTELRRRGIRTGVLSNTMWPRDAHERIFTRDQVLHLFDGAVYSSEIPRTKPHQDAFRAAMEAIGVTDPRECVFVGDRPFDDVHGAKAAGMRAVLIPNSGVPGFTATPDAVIASLPELLPLLASW